MRKASAGRVKRSGLFKKCRVLFFQHLFDVDHAHIADLRLAKGPLHDRERMFQIRGAMISGESNSQLPLTYVATEVRK